jgi:hypothetical protein
MSEPATWELGSPPACGGIHKTPRDLIEVRVRAEADGDRVFEARPPRGTAPDALFESIARDLRVLVTPTDPANPQAPPAEGRLHRTAAGFSYRWPPRAERETLTADWRDPSGAMGLRVELALPDELEGHGARDPRPALARRPVAGAGLVQRAIGLAPSQATPPIEAPARTP